MSRKTVTIATAAMLAGLLLTGCHNTSAAGDTTGGNSTTAGDPSGAQTTRAKLSKPAGAGGSCNHWSGVGTLQNAYVSLQQAASDTESYGYQDPSDGAAVNIVLTAVADELDQLPADWAEAIRNQVIFPGYSTDPSHMYSAANNAQSLALQISQLCYTP